MKKPSLSKRTRLITGIAAVLLSVALAWSLSNVLGGISVLFLLLGGAVFVWLNPELMSGN